MNKESNNPNNKKQGFFSKLFMKATKNKEINSPKKTELLVQTHQEWEIISDTDIIEQSNVNDREQARKNAEQRVAFFAAEEAKMRKAFEEAKRYASEAEEARRAAELEAAVKVAEEKAARFAETAREAANVATKAAEDFSAAEAEFNAAAAKAEFSRTEENTLQSRLDAKLLELSTNHHIVLNNAAAKLAAATTVLEEKKALANRAAEAAAANAAELADAKQAADAAIIDEKSTVAKIIDQTNKQIADANENLAQAEAKSIAATEAAEKAKTNYDKISLQLAEIEKALQSAVADAEKAVSEEEKLRETVAKEISDLEAKCQAAVDEAKAETDRIVALGIAKRQLLQEAEEIVATTEANRLAAEETAARTALDERHAQDQANDELEMISARVESALNNANSKRQNYLLAQKEVEETTTLSIKANATEKGANEKISRLLMEEKDAKLAAEMAERLTKDANLAIAGADADSAFLLAEAENVLSDTVRNANKIAEEKERARLLAEKAAVELIAIAKQRRDQATAAQERSIEAEKIWRAAEEELVKISDQAEADRATADDKAATLLAKIRESLNAAQDKVNRMRVEADSARLKADLAAKAVNDTDQMRINAEEEEARVIARTQTAKESAVKKAEDLLYEAKSFSNKNHHKVQELTTAKESLTDEYNRASIIAADTEKAYREAVDAVAGITEESEQIISRAKAEVQNITEHKQDLRVKALEKVILLEEEAEELQKNAEETALAVVSGERAVSIAAEEEQQIKAEISAKLDKFHEQADKELSVAIAARIAAEEQAGILRTKAESKRRIFDDTVRVADEEEAKRIAAEAEAAGKAVEVKAGLLKIKADSARESANHKAEALAKTEAALVEASAEIDKICSEEISLRISTAEETARLASEGEAEERSSKAKATALSKRRNKLRQVNAQAEDAATQAAITKKIAHESADAALLRIEEIKEKTTQLVLETQRKQDAAQSEVNLIREKAQQFRERAAISAEAYQTAKKKREVAEAKLTEIKNQTRQLQKSVDADTDELNRKLKLTLNADQAIANEAREKEEKHRQELQQTSEKLSNAENELRILEQNLAEQTAKLNDLRQSSAADLKRINTNATAMQSVAINKRNMYFAAQKAIEDTTDLVKEKEEARKTAESQKTHIMAGITTAKATAETTARLSASATSARESADEGAMALLEQAERALRTSAANAVKLVKEKEAILTQIEKDLAEFEAELEAARTAAAEAPRIAAEMVSVWLSAEAEIKRITEETNQSIQASEDKYSKLIRETESEILNIEHSITNTNQLIEDLRRLSDEYSAKINSFAAKRITAEQAVNKLKNEHEKNVDTAKSAINSELDNLAELTRQTEENFCRASLIEKEKLDTSKADEEAAQVAADELKVALDAIDNLINENKALLFENEIKSNKLLEATNELRSRSLLNAVEAENKEAEALKRAKDAQQTATELDNEYAAAINIINEIAPRIALAIKDTEEKAAKALKDKASLRILAEEKTAKLTLEKENKRLDLEIAERLAREAELAFQTAMDKAARFAAEAEKARQISEGRLPARL